MPEFTPDEARRYMDALRRKRAVAIDEADTDLIADLDGQIADVRQWLQRVEAQRSYDAAPAPRHSPTGIVIAGMVVAFVAAAMWNNSQPQPRRTASARSYTSPAPRRDSAMPTAIQLEVAAALELESRAADPDAVDVRTCGTVGGQPSTPPSESAPWRIRCEFTGANAFGGRVIQTATFDYSGVGLAEFVAMD